MEQEERTTRNENLCICEEPVRRCTMCGEPMGCGYIIGNRYACSDECRNALYKTHRGATDDTDAERIYLLECYELDELTEADLEWYGISQLPKDMTLETLRRFISEKVGEENIGDYCMYTEWY